MVYSYLRLDHGIQNEKNVLTRAYVPKKTIIWIPSKTCRRNISYTDKVIAVPHTSVFAAIAAVKVASGSIVIVVGVAETITYPFRYRNVASNWKWYIICRVLAFKSSCSTFQVVRFILDT